MDDFQRHIVASILILKSVALVMGCAPMNPEMTRVPLDTRVNEQDFRTACEKMARSIITIPKIANAQSPPTIALVSIENQTNSYVDKDIYLEKMRTILIQNASGRILFLDRKLVGEINEEREAKREGDLTYSTQGTKYGADFFLTGKIFTETEVQWGTTYNFIRYAFRLTDAETTAIVWEDEYESQIMNRKALMDR